ncbi:MAG: PTS sugar transporter subunit IIA [Chloroflexi bacterium]|nr:PTS sugar transporter subunit IIA [Chloroflexota bacterium]
MAHILVLSHGTFAAGLINAVEIITGTDENLDGCSLDPEKGVVDFKRSFLEIIERLDIAEIKLLILCDLYCGCPFNTAVEIANSMLPADKFKIVSGVNLPMMLETCLVNKQHPDDLELLYKTALSAGHYGIHEPAAEVHPCDADEVL